MTTYITRRLLFGVLLIILSTIVSFTILELSPGERGAVDDPRLSQAYIDQIKATRGQNEPAVKRFLNWLGVTKPANLPNWKGLLQGSLGESDMYQQPVNDVIASRIGATLILNLLALLLTWLVAIPLGTYAAVKQHKWADRILGVLSFTGMSLPGFFFALVLLWLFASRVHWLPPGGLREYDHDTLSTWEAFLDYARHLIVPVIVLTFAALASLQRITRGNMLEVLRQQYVTTARAKGLDEKKVIYKHALRNALNPLVTLLGFQFAALFGGAALLENVINYPGMGKLILDALRAKDEPLVMATFLIGSIMLVLGNLFAEILLAWVDPRVSYE
jgi:ABC-type dipeptide/oligopeptide/nickel transport system permease component